VKFLTSSKVPTQYWQFILIYMVPTINICMYICMLDLYRLLIETDLYSLLIRTRCLVLWSLVVSLTLVRVLSLRHICEYIDAGA